MIRRRWAKSKIFLLIIGLCAVFMIALIVRSGVIAAVSSKNTSQIKYETYSYKDVPLTVSLPESTDVTEDYYSSGEIIINSQLCDDVHNYHGYLQIWRISDPEEFIKKSKLNSTYHFTAYEQNKITQGNYQGFVISWSAQLQDSGYISGRDYILQNKDDEEKFLRISLTTKEKVFPDELGKIADTIVSSVVWK
ncbi:MAG: hypothetical protein ACN4A7_09505 [Thermacetogeniaceae bacterium]|jgi:hypothetical protein|nr:hypothetical protein [Thermoanaerobacterales bacterium]NLN22347.1 hypothetical protein [Syntrophomonadaceae bacterium]HAF17139.1 hypothetical protein [Peptococcaceae bacterium]